MSAKPKVLLALGVPDGARQPDAAESGSLRGNSGIAAALLDTLREKGWPVQLVLLRPGARLPQSGGDIIVNGVCEPLLHVRSLRRLAVLQLQSGLPVLNPWFVVAGAGRQSVSRRLAHQDGVIVPQCTLFRRGGASLAEHVVANGHRYPVILRPFGAHGSKGLLLARDAGEAAQAQFEAGHVTDWVDFKSADGRYRKYRFAWAGEQLFRRHVLADTQWNLTGQARWHMYEHQETIAAEKEWLSRPVTLDRGSVEARMVHQFRALQLDFGSVDFGILPGGEVVIFEVNACVQVTGSIPPEAKYNWSYLEANNGEILDALLAQLERRAARRRSV